MLLHHVQSTILADAKDTVCRRTIVSRGIGKPAISLCHADEQQVGALCYPKCRNGYKNIGPNFCIKIGCGGLVNATDIGTSCTKPSAYGRGFGYSSESQCEKEHKSCDKWGLLFYPKCKSGYKPFGCCICTPKCPSEYTDIGAFCQKSMYGRGAGTSRLGCERGLQYEAFLCYPHCSNSTIGIGPLCCGVCGGRNSVECGMFCTSSKTKCAGITLKIVGSSLKIAADIAGFNFFDAVEDIFDGGNKIVEPPSC